MARVIKYFCSTVIVRCFKKSLKRYPIMKIFSWVNFITNIIDVINDEKAMKAIEPSINKPMPHPSKFFQRNCLNKAKSSTHKVIATRLDMTPENFSQFLNGHLNIEADFALRLEKATGYSAKLWLALQNKYSLYIASLDLNI
mgnify:CR=1 FL=1